MLDTFVREVAIDYFQPSLASIVIDREHQRRRIAGSAGRTMTMIADPTTETFMIGDDGELLGSAWFIDDRDQQRTNIGYITRISDAGEATIKLTEAGIKIMTSGTPARYDRGWHVGVTLPPKQQHWEGQLIAMNMEAADTPP